MAEENISASPVSPNTPLAGLQGDLGASPHWARRDSDGDIEWDLSAGPSGLSATTEESWDDSGSEILSPTTSSPDLQKTRCQQEGYLDEYNLQHLVPKRLPRLTHEQYWAKHSWLHKLWDIDAAACPSLKEACARSGMYPALLSDIHIYKYGEQQDQTDISQEVHSPILRGCRNTPQSPVERSERSATSVCDQVKCCRKNFLLLTVAAVTLCLVVHAMVEEYQSEHYFV